jgi:large subunit ribosomal protein L19
MNIDSVAEVKPNPNIPELRSGDTVNVSVKVVEGDRERIQAFQGVVIRVRGGGAGASFTVRRISHGIGVERTFMLHSPSIEKVEVLRHGKVRRANLYYLRGVAGKAARIKEKITPKQK